MSPIKLISQITRKATLNNCHIGHYELRGSFYNTHNFEFAEMAYGGTLSLFFQRGDPASINKKKVIAAYEALKKVNPLIARYSLPKLTYSLVNYHVSENKKYIGVTEGWKNNALFSKDDTNPQATDVEFKDLIIGQDYDGRSVKYSHPSLIALMFPDLFPNCKGHYSMVPSNVPEFTNREGIYGIPEDRGGVATSTLDGENLTSFAKSRLMLYDRRFAMDPSFLFFMLDSMEKQKIASTNRFVVSTKGRGHLKKKDIVNSATKLLNKNIVSTVPPQIRSSYAYKRKNFLDLQCLFENLGSPQLFLTLSCDDKSQDFKGLGQAKEPWEDPILFALHFKRKWLKFFQKYILKHFAEQIGGIKDYSWVMEIQDRGSPHIHCVLWTRKSVMELIDLNVVHTWFPPGTSFNDPLLHELVNKLQIHKCTTT